MKPAPRFRAPFLPTNPPAPGERILISLERGVKGRLFNCSMCGNCILQETAYICPMLCPKGLRNGPCGSGSSGACCVEPSRPCVWHIIYERAEQSGRLEKKINAGAQFIQTQLVYDVEVLSRWLEALDQRNLLDKVHILVGVDPLRSAEMARYIQNHIPDVTIPDTFVHDLEQSSEPEKTGFEFALELIKKIESIPGVGRIHIMGMRWEKVIPRLLDETKLNNLQRSVA